MSSIIQALWDCGVKNTDAVMFNKNHDMVGTRLFGICLKHVRNVSMAHTNTFVVAEPSYQTEYYGAGNKNTAVYFLCMCTNKNV